MSNGGHEQLHFETKHRSNILKGKYHYNELHGNIHGQTRNLK